MRKVTAPVCLCAALLYFGNAAFPASAAAAPGFWEKAWSLGKRLFTMTASYGDDVARLVRNSEKLEDMAEVAAKLPKKEATRKILEALAGAGIISPSDVLRLMQVPGLDDALLMAVRNGDDLKTVIRGTREATHTLVLLSAAQIDDLAKLPVKQAAQTIGKLKLSQEALEHTYLGILISQRKISTKVAEELFKNLKGVPGFVSTMKKASKCNYKCTFCSLDFNQGDPNRNMRTDFLNGCVKTFARLGGERVHFSGGEPLLYPHLNDALRLVRSLGMSNALTTNGALLGAQGAKLSALVDKVNVSMPAFEQETYAAVTRSKGVLLEHVKAEAVAMRRRGICVKINAVYLEDNEETLSEMVAFFSAQDITTKIMNDMFGSRKYYEKFLTYAERWRNHPHVVIEKELNPGLPICRDCRVSKQGSCPSCRSIWLYPDGRVTICPRGQEGGFRCSTPAEAQRAIEMCWRMA